METYISCTPQHHILYLVVGKSLAIATTAVFGGATVTFMLTASKLKLHNVSKMDWMF